MGCCVSSEASSISKKDELVKVGSKSRAPPPSVEEETVKEVLSEIPKTTVKPKPDPNFTTNIKQEVQENNFLNQIQKPALNKNVAKKEELKNVNEENMSEVSEVCSLSFSETVSTTTNITDRRDNEEDQEVMQQHRMRNRKDRVVAQSPTRRFEQSPGKRKPPGSVRLVQSSREEPGRVLNQSLGRGRRDPGESSGRRSRSPASTRSAAMGRSPSARRTNQSPGRSKNESGQNGSNNHSRQTESPSKMENRWPSNNNSSTNESLENPLVSLECFIFL
ncbi:hypothetical protein Pint_10696 [Pistacia integerrima]|uniref:Uncharacterized protein n=1 Tax=Pistacia integerrima TaxID=434235 RepID=A0ACC0XKZ7_9ROSI|nr:hypothetical protein Pint_10696 [Pistacia integerrima]